MPADDLVALVAIDALGAAVPAGDHALLVEGHDGVIDHAFHQQAEALLAFAQPVLVPQALGQVARDLGIPQQAAAFVTDRRHDHAGPETRAGLARAPALFLEAAFLRGDRQFATGALHFAAIGDQET